jgi:hypothetical protein
MNKRSLLLFFLCCFCIQAVSQKCGCYIDPKKQHFKLRNKFKLTDTLQVKVNGVYLYTYVNEVDSSKTISRFYRFYPDGRVFVSCDYCSHPTLKELQDITYGGFSWYRIRENSIEVEQFGAPNYIVEKGSLSNGSQIIFVSYKPRGISSSIQKYPKPQAAVFISIAE